MKDGFWFAHYSDNKDDPAATLIIEQLGLEGYGIYWVLWETLRNQEGYSYPVKLLSSVARKYNTTFEKINQVVNGYGLFVVEDDKVFYSKQLLEIMEKYDNKKEQRSLAGKASAIKRHNAIVQQLSNDCSTNTIQDNIIHNNTIQNIIKYLNDKTGKSYSCAESNIKFIRGRLNEGRTEKDCIYVIDVKCNDWLNNPDMDQYLCPMTLFRPGNFERYLNQRMNLIPVIKQPEFQSTSPKFEEVKGWLNQDKTKKEKEDRLYRCLEMKLIQKYEFDYLLKTIEGII